MNKNKIEIIQCHTTDEGNQDNSAYILIARKNKKEQIAFLVDELGK